MQHIKDILEDLDADIDAALESESSMLARSEQIIQLVRQSIENVRQWMASHEFRDDTEEISFFKELAPEFYARLIYHLRVFHVEAKRPRASIKLQKKILQNELKDTALYFQKHAAFIEYYNAANTYLDNRYFIRDASADIMPFLLDDCSLVLDNNFCTTYTFVLSKIKAFERLQDYILKELRHLENSAGIQDEAAVNPRKWKLGPLALVEVGYMIYLTGGLPGSLKSTMEFLEKCFDTKVGNYSRTLQHMRIRKNERAAYISKGLKLLYDHMDDLDDKLE